MSKKTPIFIGEIKQKSPYGYKSKHSFIELMNLAIQYADWISVHDNALWDGDFESISFVRNNTNKPILAKGLHSTDDDVKRAFDYGADYVLVVDRFITNPDLTSLQPKILYEFSDINLIPMQEVYYGKHFLKIVYNFRDLKTGFPKKENQFQQFIDLGLWTCQASMIFSPTDVNPNVNAFIVGRGLVEYCNALNKIKKYE